jgi:hypothetical protein
MSLYPFCNSIERKENISVLKATEHDISSNQLKTRKKKTQYKSV